MLFNSLLFLFVFLPLVVVGTRTIGSPRRRVVFWTLTSYVFYGFAGPWFVALMLSSTVVDFVLARRIAASASPRKRRLFLLASLTFSLTLLGFFKYFNFGSSGFSVGSRVV